MHVALYKTSSTIKTNQERCSSLSLSWLTKTLSPCAHGSNDKNNRWRACFKVVHELRHRAQGSVLTWALAVHVALILVHNQSRVGFVVLLMSVVSSVAVHMARRRRFAKWNESWAGFIALLMSLVAAHLARRRRVSKWNKSRACFIIIVHGFMSSVAV